ncbi:tyrosine-type recombinase/integrase [Desulfurobacterium atlanticum]|uniref:Phage integrase family protein n=1 Tax=Desulfurobacterium atlanticum TaxID=240169 RepID=A0A238YS72_9BACT|nr:tyrosine-type recombinase/integrase [Desulfurobacterium atlanticum]SNR73812.1 Phage integrase family protein [Desulfurobacterium atlanticum]
MPKIVSSDGSIRISGSIIHQVKELLNLATNNGQFGIKVSHIYAEGYTKQDNPYCRSFKTAKEYVGVWYQLAEYVREEFGINKVTDIQAHHIESFIEQKADLSEKSLKNISSAIGKLENVIEQKLGIDVNFGSREDGSGRWLANTLAQDRADSPERGAYESPKELIDNLSSQSHQLVAQLQHEAGLRIHEVAGIRQDSLKFWTDLAGVQHYGIEVQGKGGYERTVEVSRELYEAVKEAVTSDGRIEFKYEDYLKDLKEASALTSQQYQGSHGLRYNFAQERYDSLISEGIGHHEALKTVSEEMGHHREEITLHYLGR